MGQVAVRLCRRWMIERWR